MKAVNLGGGPRGWLVAITAVVAVLMLAVALVFGGCGGGDNQASTGSQLDDESGTTSDQNVSTVGGTGGAEVLQGYTEDQCVAEMTTRYGDEDKARQVCDSLQADYGSSTPASQLATILPTVETQLGVTPVPGAPPVGGQTQAPGDTGTPPGETVPPPPSDGWNDGIEIVVPPNP